MTNYEYSFLTCSKVTQLSASNIGISNGPKIITDGSPHIVQTDLHTTSVWCCPTNQRDVTSITSWRREIDSHNEQKITLGQLSAGALTCGFH